MAATFHFGEDNGAVSSSHGTTRAGIGNSNWATDVNWKNVDDCTANSGTAYSASPITAGNNSFTKYQFGIFSGSYNQISSGKFSANTTNAGAAGSALATGLTLHGKVQATYSQPATTTDSGMSSPTDYTSGGPAVGSGAAVLFGADPSTAASATLAAGGGYTQYLCTQLQTTTSAAAGDTATIYVALQYSEN
ncbi:MAG TPA: hypothetical protein VH186_06290 [Chloroflexia bacterium]|nr:hypothetical protein [Chloroflexia bacterium]